MKREIFEPSEIHSAYLMQTIATANIHNNWRYYGLIQLQIPYEQLKHLNYPELEGVGMYELNFLSFFATQKETYLTVTPSFESNDGEYMGRFSRLSELTIPDKCISDIREYCKKYDIKVIVRFYPESKTDMAFDPYRCLALQGYNRKFVKYSSNRPGSKIFQSDEINYDGIARSDPKTFGKYEITKGGGCRLASVSRFQLGLKFYPLHNINFMNDLPIVLPWNELYCLQISQQLVVRSQTLFLPMYYGNKMIDTKDSHIYQNHSIVKRYNESLSAIDDIRKLQGEKASIGDGDIAENIDNQIRALEDLTVLSGKSLIIFMKHLDGSPFMELLPWCTDMSEFEMQHIWFGVFNALHLLYANGIFHGDLHLRNILMSGMHNLPSTSVFMRTVVEFIIPAPDKKFEAKYAAIDDLLKGKVKGGVENHMYYEIVTGRLTPNATPITTTQHKSPVYDHGEATYHFYEGLQRNITIIDFSRAVVLDTNAIRGIQPFKAHLRAMQYTQIYNAIKPWVTEYKNLGNQDMFISICEEETDLMLRALECLDLVLFLERYAILMKENAANIHKAIIEIITYVTPFIKINLRLADSQNFELLKKQPAIYPQLYHKFCARLLPDAEPAKKEESYMVRIGKWTELPDYTICTQCKS